jgi:hypothetical protein
MQTQGLRWGNRTGSRLATAARKRLCAHSRSPFSSYGSFRLVTPHKYTSTLIQLGFTINPYIYQYRLRTVLLHLLQKLDHDLTAGTDEDLTPSTLLSVGNCFEAIGKNRDADHL